MVDRKLPKLSSKLKHCAKLTALMVAVASCTSPLHAQMSLYETLWGMAMAGRWFPVAREGSDHTWYSDPYSIVKVSDGVFQINLFRLPYYQPPSETGHWRYQGGTGRTFLVDEKVIMTAEINCSKMQFQHVGWRYQGQVRKYKKLSNRPRSLYDATYTLRASYQVCGDKSSGNDLILISGSDSETGYWAENNKYYVSSANESIRYFRNLKTNEKVFVFCTKGLIVRDGASPAPGSGSSLEVVRDWTCKGLHPGTTAITETFTPPPTLTPSSAPPAKSGQVRLDPLIAAKRKCAELGFDAGTPKFGECVLKITR